jgi:hypothetical protein
MDRRKEERKKRQTEELMRWARIANTYFPPLWLAAGIESAAQNRWSITGLSALGMLGFATVGLWRSYRTTLRLYRGGFEQVRASRTFVAEVTQNDARAPISESQLKRGNWLERSVPGANDQQAAVAWMFSKHDSRRKQNWRW